MIKFRAWDKEENKMWNVETLYIEDEWVKVNDGSIYGVTKDLVRDYIVMQATGTRYIYDEKGKEIFEGDIVKTRASEYGRFIGYVDNAISHFEVRGVKQYKGLSVDLDGTCEIIGNIYENPELLEGE
ncbi:YopX family protein [Staphylococcus haemolyticus]|uniref:YopX family protein n=1 Tax=Staphylococcus haemolyticus TaxID=1283 RepID=UPI001D154D64|nr:YopX family protein [Staphylococcus haemolyticus]MCC3663265.1 YopX family protein [Staphylococcus haemolyticus]